MKKNILFTTPRPDTVFQRGEGVYLYDDKGNRYLDLIGGWGTNVLGHSSPAMAKAMGEQSTKLLNCSPAFYNEEMLKLAEVLKGLSGFSKTFFCSSGLEANESALKLCRKHASLYKKQAHEIISLKNSFHGRSLSLMAVSGKKNWDKLFNPKLPGVKHCRINDLADFNRQLTSKTSAVFLELIQGEGGVNQLEKSFVKDVRKLTKAYNILLVVDEIQTGIARTGKMFAFQHYNIKPDILTLAKGLGGGLPIGAMLTKKEFDLFEVGENGSTFSGQPFICRVAREVLHEVVKKKLTENSQAMGSLIKEKLVSLKTKGLKVSNIRGMGLMLAFDLEDVPAQDLAKECFKNKLIINAVGEKSIRLLPPLILNEKHISDFINIFYDSYMNLTK